MRLDQSIKYIALYDAFLAICSSLLCFFLLKNFVSTFCLAPACRATNAIGPYTVLYNVPVQNKRSQLEKRSASLSSKSSSKAGKQAQF